MGNGHKTHFWCEHRMEDSSLINNNEPKVDHHIRETLKVSDFITPTRHWNTNALTNILPN